MTGQRPRAPGLGHGSSSGDDAVEVGSGSDAMTATTPLTSTDVGNNTSTGGLAAGVVVVAAGVGAAVYQLGRRRRVPTLGDRLAADALRESIEAANAPSLADQLAAEQIREGMAIGGINAMDAMP